VGEDLLESEKIFIDTGARPLIPSIPGLETVDYLTNEGIMELTQLPVHLIILGGGYVGLEFGQMFRRFGSRVTIIHHSEQILPREDPEVAAELQKALAAEGIDFLLNTRTTAVEKKDGSITLALEGSHGLATVTGSHLLVATGRLPNADDLGVDKAGIEFTRRALSRSMVAWRRMCPASGHWATSRVDLLLLISPTTISRLFTATWLRAGRFPSTIVLFPIACSPIPNWAVSA
jgi:pyruvate/2-oxoglutarate dehydrogenase complex dihydrolipoamide dehydrogenase (E3) component